MKTAVSLPETVFKAAERHAARRRMSRSRLYAEALEEYLARYGDEAVTERLNQVYGRESSRLDPRLEALQARSIPKQSWR